MFWSCLNPMWKQQTWLWNGGTLRERYRVHAMLSLPRTQNNHGGFRKSNGCKRCFLQRSRAQVVNSFRFEMAAKKIDPGSKTSCLRGATGTGPRGRCRNSNKVRGRRQSCFRPGRTVLPCFWFNRVKSGKLCKTDVMCPGRLRGSCSCLARAVLPAGRRRKPFCWHRGRSVAIPRLLGETWCLSGSAAT